MNKPYIIGISGGSGSGKTTFIKQLNEKVGIENVAVVSQDNYYLSKEKQKKDSKGWINFDLPTAIDREVFFKDMQKLMNNIPIHHQEYTFNNKKKFAGVIEITPKPILVMEGLFIFHFREIWDLLDLTVFLHADDQKKLLRRLKRDSDERGYPEKDVKYQWRNHVKPCYQKYLKPYKSEADLVINNNRNFDTGLEVLASHLKNVLAVKNSLTLA